MELTSLIKRSKRIILIHQNQRSKEEIKIMRRNIMMRSMEKKTTTIKNIMAKRVRKSKMNNF